MMEKIDPKRAIKSMVQPVSWFKSFFIGARVVIMIICLALLGFTIYRAYFVKNQEQNIVAEEGSTLNVYQTQGDDKWFEPFSEVYVFSDTKYGMGAGVRAGLRF